MWTSSYKRMETPRIIAYFTLVLLLSSSVCGGQPFLNSLAVLFRARPPWPTTFPSSKMTPIPAPFHVSAANSQQGILVAHPISPASSFEQAGGPPSPPHPPPPASEAGKSKRPDSIGEALAQSLAKPMPTALPTIPPTLPPLIPIYPQPLPVFQNGLTAGAVEQAKALGIPPPPSEQIFGNAQPSESGHLIISPSPELGNTLRIVPSPADHHHHIKASALAGPTPSQSPPQPTNLLSLPTTVVGTISYPDAPTTGPHYGATLDGASSSTNSRKKFRHPYHHQQHHTVGKYEVGGARKHPAWNPLAAFQNSASSNSNNNHNQNDQHNNDVYQNANSLQNPSFYESSRKQKKLKDFRPSPQLNSFVETTVFTDYATHMNGNSHNNNNAAVNGADGRDPHNGSEPPTQPKLESGFRPITFNQYAPNFGTTASRPHYTNSHSQYYNPWSLPYSSSDQPQHPPPQSTENVSDLPNKSGNNENFELSVEESKGQFGHGGGKHSYYRKDRKVLHGSPSTLIVSSHEVSNEGPGSYSVEGGGGGEDEGGDGPSIDVDDAADDGQRIYPVGNRGKMKASSEESFFLLSSLRNGKSQHRFTVKGKNQVVVGSGNSGGSRNDDGGGGGIPATVSSTTASSELVEEWLPPGIRIEKKSDGRKKYPTYNKHIRRAHPNGSNGNNNSGKPMGLKGLMKLPDKCEKFNRFGFCPVTRQYPLEAAEKIASRCSALLSHLIAPLPKMDVQYDISGDGKNRSGAKDGEGGGGSRTGRNPSGWAWKSYVGKPVCDTDELTTVPGWARNEHGDWMIILQTKAWQQKAHISLCSHVASQCQGVHCTNSSGKSNNGDTKDTKCVQRFTAQRLAVFDSENPERCPVVRSVFLPSACVCLTTKGMMNTGPVAVSRERHVDGNYSTPGRQPLFSSSREVSSGGGGGEVTDDEGDSTSRGYPLDSAEANLIAESSKEQQRSDGSSRRPSYASNSIEARSSNEMEQPTVFSHRDPHNATYMIITEKFTTKESSKEEIVQAPQKVRVVHGQTTSTVRVSPR